MWSGRHSGTDQLFWAERTGMTNGRVESKSTNRAFGNDLKRESWRTRRCRHAIGREIQSNRRYKKSDDQFCDPRAELVSKLFLQ